MTKHISEYNINEELANMEIDIIIAIYVCTCNNNVCGDIIYKCISKVHFVIMHSSHFTNLGLMLNYVHIRKDYQAILYVAHT